ncbi:hypothetical protein [Streptomyces sp. NBC_01190]|uniref:hypothetical protein n=1 Tax=Streptomyces sp. NBC_01190 TaxID=2903767 RepID=UPI003866F917|nr:hypothetical protein OG519_33010 [Streptomyces sp. NBC_01190]
MRNTGQRSLPTFAPFSRRHIDPQRVAAALCPGGSRALPTPGPRTAAVPRTAG